MNREIKFRAWDGQDLVYFDLKLCNDESNVWYEHTIKNNPIMQYTGLKDRNGKEIYEGDLFQIGIEKDIYEVRFEDGCFVAYRNNKQCGIVGELQSCFVKIIGNIYENSELLKIIKKTNKKGENQCLNLEL